MEEVEEHDQMTSLTLVNPKSCRDLKVNVT